jgi:hypothetical protein
VSAAAWQLRHVEITPEALARVVAVKCTPEFVPLDAVGDKAVSR